MTEMWRMSVSLPPEMEQAIVELRKTDKYCRSPLSEIVRDLVQEGLAQKTREHKPMTLGEDNQSA